MKSVLVATLCAFMATVALSGCNTKTSGQKKHPEFSYENIVDGGIGVVGVASLVHVEADPELHQLQLVTLLEDRIVDAREAYPLHLNGEIRAAAGDVLVRSSLETYQTTGYLDASVLQQWATALNGTCRYIVFVRLDDDRTRDIRESGGTSARYPGANYTTERSIRVRIDVYDVTDASMAWGGSFEESKSNKNSYGAATVTLEESDEDSVRVASYGSAESYEYPAPPALTEVMKPVFSSFVSKLPRNVANNSTFP